MDCAKGINFIYSNGGSMHDYWGVNKATQPMLPMMAVPTTAGTGSETQSFALISDAVTHRKMACGDTKAAFRTALLDQGRPAHVYAVTRPTEVKKNDWIMDQTQGPYERGEIIYGSACPPEIPRRRRHELLNLGQIAHEDVADTEALFFCEEVRVKSNERTVAPPQGMTPPVLGLYDPGRPQRPPEPAPAGVVETARQQPRVQRAFAELDAGGDNVQWDNPAVPAPVTPGEWNQGSGRGGPFRRR